MSTTASPPHARATRYFLAVGNYMNGSTARGGAFGFKLDTLRKMAETKSADRSTTLLHFICRELEKTHPGPWLRGVFDVRWCGRVGWELAPVVAPCWWVSCDCVILFAVACAPGKERWGTGLYVFLSLHPDNITLFPSPLLRAQSCSAHGRICLRWRLPRVFRSRSSA